MTKHSRALPCIDPTKARIWYAFDALKQTFRNMTKFKLYRNNIFSSHHRKVNAQLPHTALFFVTTTPQFWSLSHCVTALKMAQLRNTASPHDPPPLMGLRFGLQRHFLLKKNVYIISDQKFSKSDQVYEAVIVELKQHGFGNAEHLQSCCS